MNEAYSYFIYNQLTNSMVQSFPWAADSCSTGYRIPHCCWTSRFIVVIARIYH